MSQIIIIDSAEALAEQIASDLELDVPKEVVRQAILACLHPIEVPSNVKELVNIIRLDSPVDNGEFIEHRWEILLDEAAALVTAHSRMVPRAMLEETVKKCWPMGSGPLYDKTMDAIAEKYGYRAE